MGKGRRGIFQHFNLSDGFKFLDLSSFGLQINICKKEMGNLYLTGVQCTSNLFSSVISLDVKKKKKNLGWPRNEVFNR